MRLDEETLKNISLLTDGEYFYAGSAADLLKVGRIALGALLAVLSARLSVF